MFVIHIIAYTYFGSIFTQNGKIETSLQLHSIARQAHDMKFVTSASTNVDFSFLVKNKIVFDAAILSSILYGCESWFGVNLDSMASGINIYSFFQISKIIILDIQKRICDILKCILDIQNTVILISDI